MDLVTAFNNLNGTTVKRSVLKSLLTRARKEKHTTIVNRISKVLDQNTDIHFTIELKNFLEPAGLSGAD